MMEEINRTDRQSLSTADLARTGEKGAEYTDEGREEEQGEEQRGFVRENRPAVQAGNSQRSAEIGVPAKGQEETVSSLFATTEAASLRSRWESLQVEFVDEPRRSVEQADQLVAEAIKRLAEGFAGEKQKLERQWDRGDKVSTEDLRQSLRRYRSFFERLLAV